MATKLAPARPSVSSIMSGLKGMAKTPAKSPAQTAQTARPGTPPPSRLPAGVNPNFKQTLGKTPPKPMAGPAAMNKAPNIAALKSAVMGKPAPKGPQQTAQQRGLGSAMGARNTGIGNAMARQTAGKVGAGLKSAVMGRPVPKKAGGAVKNTKKRYV
jgi:hypothetical protein